MNDRYKATAGARAVADSNKSDFDLDQALNRDDPLVELARIVSGRPPIDSGTRRMPSKASPQVTADLASDLEAELMGGLKPIGLSPVPKKIPDPANDWPAPAIPNPAEAKGEASKPGSVDFSGLSLRRGDGDTKRVLPLRPREAKSTEPKARETRADEAPVPRAEPGRDHDNPKPPKIDIAARRPRAAAERIATSEKAPAKSTRTQPAPFAWAAKRQPEDNASEARPEPAFDAPESYPRAHPAAVGGIEESLDAFFNQAPLPGSDSRVSGIPDDFFTPYDGPPNTAGLHADNSLTDDIAATLASYEPVPGYGLPGSDAGNEHETSHGGRRKLFLGVSFLVVALLIGGGVVVAYQFKGVGNVGEPPVISADTRPTKVAGPPADSNKDAAQQDKIFRDRIDQNSPVGKLLATGNATPANLPDVTKNAPTGSREISQLIGPGAAVGANTTPPAAGPAANDTSVDPSRVRTVRTIIVKPDATVVSSGTAPAGDPASLATSPAAAAGGNAAAANNAVPATGNSPLAAATLPPPAPASAPIATSRSVTTTREFNAGAAAPAASPAPAPSVITTTPLTGTSALAGNAPPPPRPAVGSTNNAPPVTTGQTIIATNAAPTQTTAARTASPSAGVGPQTAPTSTTTAKVANTVAPGTDGFVVQVTSQKSESQALAAFKDLQKRYPALLGDKQPDVQRADLGDKGIFFRVRVGPASSRDIATSFCEGLKSAGADCLVARN